MDYKTKMKEIIESLSKITLTTANVLKIIADNKNPVFDTDYLRGKTDLGGKQIGAIMNALTKIKIGDKQLIERLPIKLDRSNSKYCWNVDAASKEEIFVILKNLFKKYQL